MKRFGVNSFTTDTVVDSILEMEERHKNRTEIENDKSLTEKILDIMLDTYIRRFNERRIEVMAHYKVILMHFKEDVRFSDNDIDIRLAIKKFDKSLRKQIKVTDNDLKWSSIDETVGKIIKEFRETSIMRDELYIKVVEKYDYFKNTILQNRERVLENLEASCKELLLTEKGRMFEDEIKEAHDLCKEMLLDDKIFKAE
ncbi:MAG: hypothetical protein SO136_02145 [Sarcina ventriculi]|uniref:Uncharacterized protein n=1 Tax=Sarcina ventriculi TaxID=1267 RepID=A0ABM9UN75_SARVE|nr:hypothetical protein [Sarcina ventriculi]MDO4402608.1 hypothetical protein [Clostridiaceae bacterium]MBU5322186.1 hypothetical protein [Sarcina ventriculi]MCI5636187.1 hypothetical protein [Sarcina ventriculi]MDD7373910.1 hypothetical protein [Sarcina ventriculi]MDY7061698.1 hypothetical protein [Sarcina ventriculi]